VPDSIRAGLRRCWPSVVSIRPQIADELRNKAKRRRPVDDLVDALIKMRRKAKKKVAQRKKTTKRRMKSKS